MLDGPLMMRDRELERVKVYTLSESKLLSPFTRMPHAGLPVRRCSTHGQSPSSPLVVPLQCRSSPELVP